MSAREALNIEAGGDSEAAPSFRTRGADKNAIPAGLFSVNLGPARIGQSVLGGGAASDRVPYGSISGAQGASWFGTALNLMTAIIGLGVTTMPPQWAKGGIFGSLIFMIVAGFVSYGGCMLNHFNVDLTGGGEDNVQMSTVLGGPAFGAFAGISAAMQLLGTCSAYAALSPLQVKSLFDTIGIEVPIFTYPEGTPNGATYAMLVFTAIVAVPSILLKDMTIMVKASIFATFGILLFIGSTFLAMFFGSEFELVNAMFPLAKDNNGFAPNTVEGYLYTQPYYISTEFWGYGAVLNKFAFAYSVANLIPTMKKDMARPSDMPKSILFSHALVSTTYAVLSILVILVVGDGIRCSSFIMDVLPAGYRIVAAIGVIMNLLVSYPLLINPVNQMTERILGIDRCSFCPGFAFQVLNRSVIVFITILINVGIPSVIHVLDLVSAIFVSLNCTFFPPLIFLVMSARTGVAVTGFWRVIAFIQFFWFVFVITIGGYQATWFIPAVFPFTPKADEVGCTVDRAFCAQAGCYDV